MTNKEIIDAIRNKDWEKEKIFYQEHKNQCTQFALKNFFWKAPNGDIIKCKIEDAEELYNDACVSFIQNVLKKRLEHLETKIATYLINTMKYKWFNMARSIKSTTSKSILKTPANPTLSSSESTKEARQIKVRQAINRLDVKCREMMTYRYIY